MSDKEKLLGIVVLGTVIMVGGMFAVVQVMDAFDSRGTKIANLNNEIARRQTSVNRGRAAKSKLSGEFSQRSLPADDDKARADYEQWLIATANQYFKTHTIVGPSEELHGDTYRQVSFDVVDTVGTLEQLVEFLHHFYSMNTLHRIQRLDIKPLATDSRDLKLAIKLQALSIPEAETAEDAAARNDAMLLSSQLAAGASTWSLIPASALLASTQVGNATQVVADGLNNKLWIQAASDQPPTRLRSAKKSLYDYKSVILSRNLFGQENQSPKISRIARTDATTNERYSVSVDASDPDEVDVLRFQLEEAPEGAELDPKSGRLTWTPDKAGRYSFKVSVMDNGWPIAKATSEFEVRVENPRVVITRPPDPPQPPEDPKPTAEAHQTIVTAMLLDRDGIWRAWLDVRLRDKILRLKVGEKFDIGNVQGTIREIHRKEIVVEIDGRLWLLAKGESITQGVLVGEAESSDVSGRGTDGLKR